MSKQIYIIKIHSFVDVITNSSTEIYIQATERTIEQIKVLINSILELGNSKVTCNDLFEISLEEMSEKYDDEHYDISLVVVPKKSTKNAILAADILKKLTSLFNMQAYAEY